MNTNISTLTSYVNTTATDGFDRRQSAFIATKNPNNFGVIVDFGYGINGCVNTTSSVPQGWIDARSTAIAYDSTASQYPRCHRLTQFRSSSQTVLIFDGTEWNPMNPGDQFRISGGRHGLFNSAKPYGTGTTNLLFLDFHAESAPRIDLPTAVAPFPPGVTSSNPDLQFWGTLNYSRSPKYRWTTDQQ